MTYLTLIVVRFELRDAGNDHSGFIPGRKDVKVRKDGLVLLS